MHDHAKRRKLNGTRVAHHIRIRFNLVELINKINYLLIDTRINHCDVLLF